MAEISCGGRTRSRNLCRALGKRLLGLLHICVRAWGANRDTLICTALSLREQQEINRRNSPLMSFIEALWGRRAAGEVPRLYADNLIFIKATCEAGALARSLVCRCCTLCVHRDKATRRALRTQTIKSAPTKGALRRKSIIVCPLSGVLSLFSVCTFPAALLWHFALLHH